MGELRQPVSRWGLGLVLTGLLLACGPSVPTPTPASGDPSPAGPTDGSPSTTSGDPIDPAAARLVWTVDAAGGAGIWTTDLAGGDVRSFVSGADDSGGAIRDATAIGDVIVFIRDTPGGPVLWLARGDGPPTVLLDGVAEFVVGADDLVVAVRDEGPVRRLYRIDLRSGAAAGIGELPPTPNSPEIGPFGTAVAPDGLSVAAGWVGGPVVVVGPNPARYRDVGAPLVVDDDGLLVASTGRAGEAYRVEGDTLTELAPPDSDPAVAPGSGIVAWGALGEDGTLRSVELRDLLSGDSRSYPGSGRATNVRAVTGDHVILEATAFDPLSRTVAYLELATGRFAVFEAAAPPG